MAPRKRARPAPLRRRIDRAAPLPRVLVTGFEAFDGQAVNPSALVAAALGGRQIARHRVIAACLPTAFGASRSALTALLGRHRPVLVVCLGQAGGRAAISLERVAINLVDARIPDNAGAQPIDEPVVPGAPAAWFSTLPVKVMRDAILATGTAAELSHTAGTFVCNHVFFSLMQALSRPARPRARGGFIHLPWLPEQARVAGRGVPSLPLEEMVAAIRVAIAAALTARSDDAGGPKNSGGTLH